MSTEDGDFAKEAALLLQKQATEIERLRAAAQAGLSWASYAAGGYTHSGQMTQRAKQDKALIESAIRVAS